MWKNIMSKKMWFFNLNLIRVFVRSTYDFNKRMGNVMSNTGNRLMTQQLLGDNGVFILPVFPSVALEHFSLYFRFLDSAYVSLFNLLEMPSTVCTVGMNKGGLPLTVQVVANKFEDRLTLAVARELQNAFGGWTPPSES